MEPLIDLAARKPRPEFDLEYVLLGDSYFVQLLALETYRHSFYSRGHSAYGYPIKLPGGVLQLVDELQSLAEGLAALRHCILNTLFDFVAELLVADKHEDVF